MSSTRDIKASTVQILAAQLNALKWENERIKQKYQTMKVENDAYQNHIAWLRQQNDEMTEQLVWFADKIDDTKSVKHTCTQKVQDMVEQQKEEVTDTETDTPNTPQTPVHVPNLADHISLISEMSLNDVTTNSMVQDMDVDDDKQDQNENGNDIDDIDVLTIRSIGYIEEMDDNDIQQLIRKCSNREPVKAPKRHRRSKKNHKNSKKKKNEWFWLLGKAYI